MVAKLLCLFVLGVVSQGYAQTDIILEDVTVNHYASPWLSTTLSLHKPGMFDTLLSCAVGFPHNIMYEAYPADRLPKPSFQFVSSVEPFRTCTVAIRDVAVSASGTYQLIAVTSDANGLQTRTRRNFKLNVRSV
ncbi:unnamed protein product [Plutella xylostella]|uniref:(diamondback moth) hypothetical protein n=1 Tax=Plutella xylostella TaxID=51655 RepID=A0A8S4FWE6_PLUXY|nr:unnamed protein product [Plutella xylostella]